MTSSIGAIKCSISDHLTWKTIPFSFVRPSYLKSREAKPWRTVIHVLHCFCFANPNNEWLSFHFRVHLIWFWPFFPWVKLIWLRWLSVSIFTLLFFFPFHQTNNTPRCYYCWLGQNQVNGFRWTHIWDFKIANFLYQLDSRIKANELYV